MTDQPSDAELLARHQSEAIASADALSAVKIDPTIHAALRTILRTKDALAERLRAAQSGGSTLERPTHDDASGTAGGSPADSRSPAAPSATFSGWPPGATLNQDAVPVPNAPGPTVRDVEEAYGYQRNPQGVNSAPSAEALARHAFDGINEHGAHCRCGWVKPAGNHLAWARHALSAAGGTP